MKSFKSLEQKAIKFIDRNNLVSPDDSVLIALSGGPDSVLLLLFFEKFKKRFGIDICAAHVNHHLRGNESYEDETFCIELCKKLSVKIFTDDVDVDGYSKKNNIGVEEAARILRYDALKKICKENKINKIATAHTKNDNTETVLLNLIKGSGITGLSGIPVQRENIIRPLLDVTKEEILDYLGKINVEYREDSTNFESEFERNFLRNEIIPVIKSRFNIKLDDAVFRTSNNIRSAGRFIESVFNKIKNDFVIESNDSLLLKDDLFNNYGIDAVSEIVKRIIEQKFGIAFIYTDYQKIRDLFLNQKGKMSELNSELKIFRENDGILILKNSDNKFDPVKIYPGKEFDGGWFKLQVKKVSGIKNYKSNRFHEIISAENTDEEFTLRKWRRGDRFKPLGMKNFKKVSDFLNEQKIPAHKKKDQLILENRNNIVWIIGLRIDDRYKITSQTKSYYDLWMKTKK
ncbi:MAG: tRNA lysidine(34) synthetase TilS [Melioribacteraceae bacterium]|nr:tRNA lysidine(34) synthetase TilS [Melioribacteraceae bacterium]MCF8354795.1 tRNA lysidine(34) synthetase TilS [Melioribacteraceae bacterium]MCF8393311.1 tRNA lysidine(34) synthetase TilS [Melioribacteraceae bacterium]MCF8419163.1 tRNA lysidine(34) synthetase TilS [Melioribacteraceae bacterium]